jgi:hypothetical protein
MRFVTTSSVNTSTIPLVVRWGPSGQVYEVQERVNDTTYRSIRTGQVVSVTRTARSGYEYRYRVRARDGSGWTDWASGPEVAVVRYDDPSSAISYAGTWRSASGSGYIGRKVKYATARGARATLSFTGRSVAVVGPKGPTRGRANVYVDGRYVKTISLYSSSYRARQVIFVYNWSSSGAHRVKVVVSGTSGHPMVAIDALYILR